jgi:hypothetical protein
MSKTFRWPGIKICFFCFLSVFLFVSCVSHLKDAKFYYVQAQKYSRIYKTREAVASYRKALEEAEKASRKNPSAQAYMLKGMAALNLGLWEKAEQSFLTAFSYGFEKGEEWAEWVSLFGLAVSLQEMGLEKAAFQLYADLLERAKLEPISVLSAQKYTDGVLEEALQKKGKDREKMLIRLLKKVENLTKKNMGCGYYHYLQSQILSHLSLYRRSFEEAVIAKELALPAEEISRDNDQQIVYCYKQLKETLPLKEWETFQAVYLEWIKRWNWQDPEIPEWKKR